MQPEYFFDHKIMNKHLQESITKISDIPVEPFLLMLREILKIFEQMGGILSKAFSGFKNIHFIPYCF